MLLSGTDHHIAGQSFIMLVFSQLIETKGSVQWLNIMSIHGPAGGLVNLVMSKHGFPACRQAD